MNLSSLFATIGKIIAVVSTGEGGYGMNKKMGRFLQPDMGAYAVVMLVFVVAAVVALFINGAMLYDYINKGKYLTTEFMSFERLFDFWV